MRRQTIARIHEAWLRAGSDPVFLRYERAKQAQALRRNEQHAPLKNPPYELAFKKLARGDTTLIENMLRARIPLSSRDFGLFATHFERAFPLRGTKVHARVLSAEETISHRLKSSPRSSRAGVVKAVAEELKLPESYLIDRDRRAKRPVATYVAAVGKPHRLPALFLQNLPLQGSAFEALAKLIVRNHKKFRPVNRSVKVGGRGWKYWQNVVATIRAYRLIENYKFAFELDDVSPVKRRGLVETACREVRTQYACGPIDAKAVLKNLARDGKRIRAILDDPTLIDFPKTP